MKRLIVAGLIATAASLAILVPGASATTGTWTLDAPWTPVFKTTDTEPINPDGTSVFSAMRGIIPVQFHLNVGKHYLFESIGSDLLADNDYSAVTFTPSEPLLFSEVTNLQADMWWDTGTCHGGSLRWSIETGKGNVFVYFGWPPNFDFCPVDDPANLIGTPDLRYDTTQVGGTFYDSYEHALALVGDEPVSSINLVLDGGWAGDQSATPFWVTVNDNRWTWPFEPTEWTQVCGADMPPATISYGRDYGESVGVQNEAVDTSLTKDDGDSFRIVDCKYKYNLDVRSAFGGQTGTYFVTGTLWLGGSDAMVPHPVKLPIIGTFGLK